MAQLQFIITTNSAGAVMSVQRYQQALAGLGPTAANASNQTTSAFDRIEATLNKAKSAIIGFISAFVFREIIHGMSEVIQAGIDFEASFAGIKKTVDATDAQFEELSGTMRQLA